MFLAVVDTVLLDAVVSSELELVPTC